MIRKLIVAGVSSLMSLCLLGLGITSASAFTPSVGQAKWWSTPEEYQQETGKTIVEFQESPILRARVAAGELPPVEERLPEDFLVVRPYEKIGEYSSKPLKVLGVGTRGGGILVISHLKAAHLNRAATELVPDALKGWEFSEDGKILTLYLRKGLKWSDGVPVTADDILFWWEDFILNDELTPVKPSYVMPGGELMTVEKVDDYTVRYNFSEPYWLAPRAIFVAGGAATRLGLPKHALEKFHIKYNKDADKFAKEKGFDNWAQLFQGLTGWYTPGFELPEEFNKAVPTSAPWVYKKKVMGGMIWERNPYYSHVDTEGNQLPYIDTILITRVENVEVYNAKIMAGEVDFASWGLSPSLFSLFTKEAKKGEYRVQRAGTDTCANFAIWFNQNYKDDPVLAKILRDVRFRQALSLGMNRNEINEALFFSLGTPSQMTMTPTASSAYFFKEEWVKTYVEYDPGKANQLLDEMGLKWDEDHEHRLRSDGKSLIVELRTPTDHLPWYVPIAEMLVEQWKQIGVQLELRGVLKRFFYQSGAANEHQLSGRSAGNPLETEVTIVAWEFLPSGPSFATVFWCPLWQEWMLSGGESGEEPPEWLKELVTEAKLLPFSDKEQIARIMTNILDMQADNLFAIGTVGMVDEPAVIANDLGNVAEAFYSASSASAYYLNGMFVDEFFWKK